MKLSDYLRDHPVSCAILFIDRVSKANALLRQLNLGSDLISSGITASTVCDYAKELVSS